jgi:hypothetical protein
VRKLSKEPFARFIGETVVIEDELIREKCYKWPMVLVTSEDLLE